MRTAISFILAASIVTVACGGEAPAPKPPESEPVGAADAGADMPPPAATTAATDPKPETTPGVPDPRAEAPKPEGVGLPKDTVKIALKGKKTATLELKSDGTVTNGGKNAAKITSTEVQDKDGKALLSVTGDAVATPGGTSVAKFEGDDLVGAKGDKLSLGADGALTWTAGGKGTPVGKAEGGDSAKHATLLAAWFVLSPPPADKAPAKVPAAGGDKPAAKPAGGAKKK